MAIFILLIPLLILILLFITAFGKQARILTLALIAVLIIGLGTVFLTRPAKKTFSGETMGTTYSVTLSTPNYRFLSAKTYNEFAGKLQSELDRINSLMSTYDANSELSKLNKHNSTSPFPVSEETARIITQALEIAQKTGGVYDPTVGPLVNLWRFGPEDRPVQIPTDEEIAAAKNRLGWNKIKVENLNGQFFVIKSQPDIYIDLSSIAKGYGVDCLAKLLKANQCKNFLIDIGGELRGEGKNPAGQYWSVGIRRPAPGGRLQKITRLENESIATSGGYMNYYEVDGKRYSHIIDTKTGRPIEHKTASVSVIAQDCAWADGWATALLAAGEERGIELAKENKLNAAFIVNRDGQYIIEKVKP